MNLKAAVAAFFLFWAAALGLLVGIGLVKGGSVEGALLILGIGSLFAAAGASLWREE